MTPPSLSAPEKKFLRGRAQTLEPVIHIGKKGLTDTLLKELELVLVRDQLIKIKIAQPREELAQTANAICEKCGAALVSSVGKSVAICRPLPTPSEGA